MACTRAQYVAKLKEWAGYSEANGKHKIIIDIYNKQSKLPRSYKVKYTDSWCATTVSAAAIECKATDIIPVECSCPQMVELAKKMGIWVEKDSYKPKKGDIILYDWQDSGSGDNTGTPDHIGVVTSISGNTFKVIEGNRKDSVCYRTMNVNGQYIRGFICPKFKEATVAPAEPEKKDKATEPAKDMDVPTKYTVTAKSGLNYRVKPNGTKKGIYPYGAKVTITETSKESDGEWGKTSTGYWCFMKYLERV